MFGTIIVEFYKSSTCWIRFSGLKSPKTSTGAKKLRNKDLLFPDVRNRPSDSISFENPFRAPKGSRRKTATKDVQTQLVPTWSPMWSPLGITLSKGGTRPHRKAPKGFSKGIGSEGLFRTSENSRSLFLSCLTLVEVFDYFGTENRTPHVELI